MIKICKKTLIYTFLSIFSFNSLISSENLFLPKKLKFNIMLPSRDYIKLSSDDSSCTLYAPIENSGASCIIERSIAFLRMRVLTFKTS